MSTRHVNATDLDALLDRIATHHFRAKFHLRPAEASFVALRGLGTVRRHAYELLATRLVPAHPKRDGKQTPWGGHPVFRAQHATGTCCRTCLSRTHKIRAGRDLTDEELDYVVDVICRWVEREVRQHRPGEARPVTDPPV
ncbi:DUF4186 domain-containing protein [Gordonia sinesedis]